MDLEQQIQDLVNGAPQDGQTPSSAASFSGLETNCQNG